MSFSEQVEKLYLKSVFFGLNKLHRELINCKKEDVNKILVNKPYPTFSEFKNSIVGERKYFSFKDGFFILKCYVDGEKYDVNNKKLELNNLEFNENVQRLFHKNKFGIRKLLKEIKKLDREIIEEILKGRPFPNQMDFENLLSKKSKKTFSIYEGLLLLRCYSINRKYDYEEHKRELLRIDRAKRQSENLLKRDLDGLLGYVIPREKKDQNDENKKPIVRSVWTVKKK
jgi:hypothetical protein